MAALSIYTMNPLVPNVEPKLPDEKIFYKVHSYLGDSFYGSSKGVEPLPPHWASLAHRQETILSGLKALKAEIDLALPKGAASNPTSSVNEVAAPKTALQVTSSTNAPLSLTKNDVVVQCSVQNPALVSLITTHYLVVGNSRQCTTLNATELESKRDCPTILAQHFADTRPSKLY